MVRVGKCVRKRDGTECSTFKYQGSFPMKIFQNHLRLLHSHLEGKRSTRGTLLRSLAQ